MAADATTRTATHRSVLRETEGLTACLLADRDEVLRWKDENPLRLVAAAILDAPRPRAVRKDLGESLVPAIIAPEEWENWWKVVQPAVRDSKSFDYHARNGTRLQGRTNPSAIEPVTLSDLSASSCKTAGARKSSAPPSVRIDWIDWVESDAPIPTGTPPDSLANYLSRQRAEIVPDSVAKLRAEIEGRILGVGSPPKTSGTWVKYLAASLDRWTETAVPSPASIAEIVGLTARLIAKLGVTSCQTLIELLSNYTSANADNARVMADAVLTASLDAPSETATILERIHALLGEPARKALWMRLVTSNAGQVSDWLIGRWMRLSSDAEKSDMVSALLVSSRAADYKPNLDSLLDGNRNLPQDDERLFNPILMSWFLHRDMMPRVARTLKERVNELREENERLRAEHRREIAEKDRLLSVAETNLERAARGEKHLQGELQKTGNAIALSISRDAIVILGEVLQQMSTLASISHREVESVKARITLALMSLGAEQFGKVGEVVPFDSGVHDADSPPVMGTPVIITVPGVAYFENGNTPKTMVKIKVQVEERS